MFRRIKCKELIVFQMLKGATDEQRKEWKMPCGKHFVWLPNSEKTVEGWSLHMFLLYFFMFSDSYNKLFFMLFFLEDSFQETVEAMVHLGIKAERQRQLFRVRDSSKETLIG